MAGSLLRAPGHVGRVAVHGLVLAVRLRSRFGPSRVHPRGCCRRHRAPGGHQCGDACPRRNAAVRLSLERHSAQHRQSS
ncbi:MAG: (2Fe-2S)-binding protein [Rhodovulum sp.]|nr:(2Fe-2S)-binding protein [Rhodovulum sp.]